MAALDEKWYPMLTKVGLFEDYTYLEGDREYRKKEQEKFLAGRIENPILDYPLLNSFDFDGRQAKLQELQEIISAEEKNTIVSTVYKQRIQEKLDEISLLRAARDGDDERVTYYSSVIYGALDPAIFQYVLQTTHLVACAASMYGKKAFEASARLQSLCLSNMADRMFPTPYSVGMPAVVDESSEFEYDAEGILREVNESLERYGLSQFGWKSVIDDRSVSINARQEDRTIRIPRQRKVKKTKLRALIQHEVYYHAGRRERGEQSKLMLLGFGLHHYLRGEEGVALWAEQQVRGGKSFGEVDRYLAIALARGVDGHPRDFRTVFDVLKDYFLIELAQEQNHEPDIDTVHEAERKAWLRCVRTFRGTSCQHPGQVFMKDKIYVEGNMRVWQVAINKPYEIRRFPVGKYNPSDPTHIHILDALDIHESASLR